MAQSPRPWVPPCQRMRRADRLFQIVQLIRGRRLSTAQFLAQRLEVSEFAAQRRHALLVPYVLRIGELSLYLRGPLDSVPEPVAETQISVLGAAAGLPYF